MNGTPVALVTGADGAIGAAIARRLHADGLCVVAAAHRSTRRAEPLAAELGTPLLIADLAAIGEPRRLVDETVAATGRLDLLVNNAGIQPVEPFNTLTAAAWDEVLTVDLRATQVLTAAAATVMHEGGAVVNIASIEAHQPAAGHAHYAAAKAGLVMATRAAALELGPSGIRINSVSPGLIDDGRLAERWPEGVDRWLAAAPLGRLGTPEDVADAGAVLGSDQARWITGVDLVGDGGVLARPTW